MSRCSRMGCLGALALGTFASPGIASARSFHSAGAGGGAALATIFASMGHGGHGSHHGSFSSFSSYSYPSFGIGLGGGIPVYLSPPVYTIPTPQMFWSPAAYGPMLPGPLAPGMDMADFAPRRRPLADQLPRPGDPKRGQQLTTYGDRLFRSGNVHRAAERYQQAVRADPQIAAPHVGLAQVAISRGHFAEAASEFGKALEVQPNLLARAPDVQALYGEPADFARMIARIESHLQATPNDRDAWFVLGAQWYLSGRTRKAADVFLRLADRKADPALAAFLDASTPVAK